MWIVEEGTARRWRGVSWGYQKGLGMRPLAYGYVRIAERVGLADLPLADRALRGFAYTEGFDYPTAFIEYGSESFDAFDELVRELRRTECRHLLVLSLDNLCQHEIIRRYVIDRLGVEANVAVHSLPDSAWTLAQQNQRYGQLCLRCGGA